MRFQLAPMQSAFVLALCTALVVTVAPGQVRQHRNSIVGVVLDVDSRSPLVNVNVFLSNTKIGTGTDARGAFTLTGIPSGKYNLVFSRVGYERVIRSVLLNADTTIMVNAHLKPRVITIAGVDVVGEGSGNAWERTRNIRIFLEEFLGKTSNAKGCRVLHQELIRLWIDSSERLNASTDSAIIVENRALGYRLYVELISFTYDIKLKGVKLFYYPRFEELAPVDSEEARRWEANRAKSYLGSRRHFFRSLFSRSLRRDNYFVTSGRGGGLVYRPGYPVTDSLHLSFSRDSMTCVLTMDAPLYNAESYRVDFRSGYPRSRLDDYSSSIFEARQSQIRVAYGELEDPRSIAVYGRWARERVADELPLEYVVKEQ
ncbi:MAG: carboxypeptidase-like regulatory domain-containing protein [Ignavibacteria bacterium]|nr:carboxypeptidase-like regulatory domain-containing protein [Ignavibacteria bacterium]